MACMWFKTPDTASFSKNIGKDFTMRNASALSSSVDSDRYRFCSFLSKGVDAGRFWDRNRNHANKGTSASNERMLFGARRSNLTCASDIVCAVRWLQGVAYIKMVDLQLRFWAGTTTARDSVVAACAQLQRCGTADKSRVHSTFVQ